MRSLLGLSWLLLWASHAPALTAAQPERGSIAVLDANTGNEIARLRANGAVVDAVADGRGGWFVGGNFTRLGGQRQIALAHVMPNGRVDPDWRASIWSASGRPVAVHNLARAGARLFLAGPFGRVGGQQRPGLAAIDANSGALVRSWRPRPLAWPDVHELLVAGPRLLVARQSSYPRPGITALDTRTGSVDRGWNARLRLIGGAGSFNTLLRRGARVYLGGSFHVLGLRRNGLVALNANNGTPDPRFAPHVPNCAVCNRFGVIYGLATSQRRLYISGYFDRIAGLPRPGIAALNPRTGAVDPSWRPAQASRTTLELALAGPRLYLGGLSGLHVLNARTGASLPHPRTNRPRQVLSLALSGGRLLVSGRD